MIGYRGLVRRLKLKNFNSCNCHYPNINASFTAYVGLKDVGMTLGADDVVNVGERVGPTVEENVGLVV